MSESVVADFLARFHTPDVPGGEPTTGRVLLSQQRLVLAAEFGKTTIPLSAVFDVSVGEVPPELSEFFSDTVTVAYSRDDARRVAVVEGDDVDRFTTVLFKVLVQDTTVTCRHPVRRGGRVTDADPAPATVRLEPGAVEFAGPAGFRVDLETVTEFRKENRELAGQQRPVLRFRHMPNGESLTSLVGVDSGRDLNVLGRYIRLEYEEVMAEVRDLDPTAEEMEALVSLYSAGDAVHLGELVNVEASQLTMILNSLSQAGLVVDADDATKLTPKGRVVVSQRLEQVNAQA